MGTANAWLRHALVLFVPRLPALGTKGILPALSLSVAQAPPAGGFVKMSPVRRSLRRKLLHPALPCVRIPFATELLKLHAAHAVQEACP